jgi:hypothetical protein
MFSKPLFEEPKLEYSDPSNPVVFMDIKIGD